MAGVIHRVRLPFNRMALEDHPIHLLPELSLSQLKDSIQRPKQ